MTYQEDVRFIIRADAKRKGITIKQATADLSRSTGIPANTLKDYLYSRRKDNFTRSDTRTTMRRRARYREQFVDQLDRGEFVDISNLFQTLTQEMWENEGAEAMLTGPIPDIIANPPGAQVVAEAEVDLEGLEGIQIQKSGKGLSPDLNKGVAAFIESINEFFDRYTSEGEVLLFRPTRVIFKAMPLYVDGKFQKMKEVNF